MLFLRNSAQVSSDVARATLRQYRVLLARRGSVQICVRGKILCIQAMHSTTGSRSQALWSGRWGWGRLGQENTSMAFPVMSLLLRCHLGT